MAREREDYRAMMDPPDPRVLQEWDTPEPKDLQARRGLQEPRDRQELREPRELQEPKDLSGLLDLLDPPDPRAEVGAVAGAPITPIPHGWLQREASGRRGRILLPRLARIRTRIMTRMMRAVSWVATIGA